MGSHWGKKEFGQALWMRLLWNKGFLTEAFSNGLSIVNQISTVCWNCLIHNPRHAEFVFHERNYYSSYIVRRGKHVLPCRHHLRSLESRKLVSNTCCQIRLLNRFSVSSLLTTSVTELLSMLWIQILFAILVQCLHVGSDSLIGRFIVCQKKGEASHSKLSNTEIVWVESSI